jgi:WD40 repeat protein
LPEGAVARLGTTRLRHGDAIFFTAYTPDGKGLLTAGVDQAVRLWELPTGRELRRFDWGKGAPAGEVPYYAVALSPDGKAVAAARGGRLFLWDAATGKLLHQVAIEGFKYGGLAFAADGKALLTLNQEDQSVLVWDVASGKNTRQLAKPSGKGFANAIAVSPDWKYLASLHTPDGRATAVKIKDLAADRELPEVPILGDIWSAVLAFSADSKVLARKALNGPVVLWDVAAHKERARLEGGETRGPLNALALSANGKFVAVSDGATFDLWDARTGKKVASGGEPRIEDSALVLHSVSRQYHGALAFAPDAKTVAASFGGALVSQFDTASGKMSAGPGTGHRAGVSLLGVSGDGKAGVTYGRGDPLRL